MILKSIEDDITRAGERDVRITTVEIYRAKSNGDDYIPAEKTDFTRTGSLTCTMPDGTTSTVPYTRTVNGYPELNRCNILAGCGGTHTTIDHIGDPHLLHPRLRDPARDVRRRRARASTFERSNVMRMEPIL